MAVKINLKHIAEGWAKSIGLYEVSEENKSLSKARMNVCATCRYAEESSFLKFIGRGVEQMGAIVCNKCPSKIKCPINEKTLVVNEKCPEGKW